MMMMMIREMGGSEGGEKEKEQHGEDGWKEAQEPEEKEEGK